MSRKLGFETRTLERGQGEMDLSVEAIRIQSISQEVNVKQKDRGSKTPICVKKQKIEIKSELKVENWSGSLKPN